MTRDRLIGALCAACLGILALFFLGSLVWMPSKCTRDSSDDCAMSAKTRLIQVAIEERADDKIARYTEMLAFFTAALVLVSAVQIWFLTQADRTAQKTAGAALKAAIATENSVEVAKIALRDTERAFVYLKTVEVLVKRGPSTIGAYGAIEGPILGCIFTPIWANSGRTPARRMLTCSHIEKFGAKLPDDISFDERRIPRRIVLGPRTETYTTGSSISEDEYHELLRGEKKMFILGWADYDDIFPGTARHRTEFCLQIMAIKQDDGGTRVVLPTYSRLNGFDDECQNNPRPYYPPPLVY